MHACIDTDMYIRTYIHTYIHTRICAYVRRYIHTYMHACMHACMHTYIIYIYIYERYGTPPPMVSPPPPGPPGPRPAQHSRTTGTNPRKPEGGRTMENDASQCFFTGAENRIRAGTGAPFARRKEQHHILYGSEHVTMTLLLTSGSNHTSSL